MAELFGTDIASLMADSFAGQLVPATLTRTVITGYDPITDEQTTETQTFTTEGVVTAYSDEMIANGVVQTNDREILLLAVPLGTEPTPGSEDAQPDKITIEGITYTVVGVPSRDPATATYTVQGRIG